MATSCETIRGRRINRTTNATKISKQARVTIKAMATPVSTSDPEPLLVPVPPPVEPAPPEPVSHCWLVCEYVQSPYAPSPYACPNINSCFISNSLYRMYHAYDIMRMVISNSKLVRVTWTALANLDSSVGSALRS